MESISIRFGLDNNDAAQQYESSDEALRIPLLTEKLESDKKDFGIC